MGLSSVVDCKGFDKAPAFRAQVQLANGITPQPAQAQAPPRSGSVMVSCDSDGCPDDAGNRYVYIGVINL